VRTPLVLGVVGAAILVLPLVVPPYYVTLMLPFMAYGVVLLGFNLLFGYPVAALAGALAAAPVGALCVR